MTASMLRFPRFRACRQWLGFLLLFLICAPQLPAQSQPSKKIQKLLKSAFLKKRSAADSLLIAGNKIYEIVLEDTLGEGIGLFTIRTGEAHPINGRFDGAKQDLLGGGSTGETGSSYITVRSYSSGRDYVQSDFIDDAPGFRTAWLDSLLLNSDNFNPVLPIRNRANKITGFQVTYDLHRVPKTSDKMRLITRTEVHGTNFDDSWVEITTIVENMGDQPLEIGIRYLLDLKIAGDDGPAVKETALGAEFGPTEAHSGWVNFAYFMAGANDTIRANNPAGALPGYNVYGSGITPANLLRTPLQPTVVQHVSWPLAFLKPFSYEVHPNFVVTRDAENTAPGDRTGGDNAILYYWGETRDNTITIQPGEKIQVTQAILASPPDDFPPLYDRDFPMCDLAAVNPGPPKSFEFVVQDEVSGIRLLRPFNDFNATIEAPDFPTGTLEPIRLVGAVIDESKPFGFNLRVIDLCGNEIICDPIFLTLRPELRVFEHRFDLIPSDRYFYIKNQGIRRIVANLNGHEFVLSAERRGGLKAGNLLYMPLHGEMAIDMVRYMKPAGNTMSIAFEGPDGSRGDLVISDMKMKSMVDAVLDIASIPQEFALRQNLPNPFRGATEIRFEVPERAPSIGGAARVELKVYNVLGQLVRTLVDAGLQPGAYTTNWNGRDAGGRLVSAGIYFYHLNANGIRITKKMALIQ